MILFAHFLTLHVLIVSLSVVRSALDPAKLIGAYFTSSSFDGKEDSLYIDQSGNRRNIDVGRITHFNDAIDFVNFGASNDDGVAVRAFERHYWGEHFGVSLWYRRTSGRLSKQGLIGNTNDADTGSFGIFTEGYDTVDAGTLGFEIITDQNENRQWRQEFAGLYSREDQWHHLVLTVNGQYVNFYLDNKVVKFDGEEYNQPATGKLWVDAHPLQIGGKLNGGEAFLGDLKEIYLYDQFLTADDVNLLFGGPTASPTEAPSVAPAQPTPGPTPSPTATPTTARPTASPTVQASNPTLAPTVEWVPTPYPTERPPGTMGPTSTNRQFTARPTVSTLSTSGSSTTNNEDTMTIITVCLASALGLMCIAGIYGCKDHIYTIYSEWDDIEIDSSTINPFETWMQHIEKRNSLTNATADPTVKEEALPDTIELGEIQGPVNTTNPMLATAPPTGGSDTDNGDSAGMEGPDASDAIVDYVVASTDKQSLGTAVDSEGGNVSGTGLAGIVSPMHASNNGNTAGSADRPRRGSSVYVPPTARGGAPPPPRPPGGDSSALMKSILSTNKTSASVLMGKRGTLAGRRQTPEKPPSRKTAHIVENDDKQNDVSDGIPSVEGGINDSDSSKKDDVIVGIQEGDEEDDI